MKFLIDTLPRNGFTAINSNNFTLNLNSLLSWVLNSPPPSILSLYKYFSYKNYFSFNFLHFEFLKAYLYGSFWKLMIRCINSFQTKVVSFFNFTAQPHFFIPKLVHKYSFSNNLGYFKIYTILPVLKSDRCSKSFILRFIIFISIIFLNKFSGSMNLFCKICPSI